MVALFHDAFLIDVSTPYIYTLCNFGMYIPD